MKRIIFIIPALLVLMSSCVTTTKTARTEDAPFMMYNATAADLKVAPKRIYYTLVPSDELLRGGEENCKRAAVNEALVANGNADLLIEPEFTVTKKRGLFKTKITSITVSGRPATYVNFRSLPDKVWSNPVFRMGKENTPSEGLFSPSTKNRKNRNIRYQGDLNLGYETASGVLLETIHGARFNKYLFAGIGIGYHYIERIEKNMENEGGHELTLEREGFERIPIFVNLKGYLPISDGFTPYLNLSLGGGFDANGLSGGGFYGDLGVGFKSRLFNFGLGWMRHAEVHFERESWDHQYMPHDSFYLKVGLTW